MDGNQPVKVDDLALVSGKLAALVPLWSGKARKVTIDNYANYEMFIVLWTDASYSYPISSSILLANEKSESHIEDLKVASDGAGNITTGTTQSTADHATILKVYGLGGGHS